MRLTKYLLGDNMLTLIPIIVMVLFFWIVGALIAIEG